MKPKLDEMRLSDVIFDEVIYPRKEHDPALVQRYAGVLDEIEAKGDFIAVAADNKLLDGKHRWLAYRKRHQNDGDSLIRVYRYNVSAPHEQLKLAASLNSDHGWQLTDEDKKYTAQTLFGYGCTFDDIAATLSVGKEKVSAWLSKLVQDKRERRDETIRRLWLACHGEAEIATTVGCARQTVGEVIANFAKIVLENRNGKICRSAAHDDDFAPQVYSIWNFPRATNAVRHPGNVPPEILDNLLYYYTKPFDVVFDPFAGGGMAIDVCKKRLRRYFVSDLTPIEERQDEIRQHDITAGLPDGLPVPDLVFLDPPYWRQCKGRYSDKKTDLSNVTLAEFLDAVAALAQGVKRKWRKDHCGKLALLMGTDKHAGAYTDVPFLCYQRIAKYLNPALRIIVPYNTEITSGAFVKAAQEKKEILCLYRDLMIFSLRD
jgi:DNA modification methylase